MTGVTVAHRRAALDGSVKRLLRLDDGRQVEAVELPHGRRRTLCVSSQVGCVLDCAFCATGTMRFERNLSADEITGQLDVVRADRNSEAAAPGEFTNIVFMGMGEPFYNYDNVLAAAAKFADPRTYRIAPRRITISTAGVLPAIERYFEEAQPYNLAISITSAIAEKRDRLMPINQRYPVSGIEAALRAAPRRMAERVLLEVPLLAGVNDQEPDALALLALIRDLPVRVNLIPWNPAEAGAAFATPDRETTLAFQRILRREGAPVFIRKSLGRDVMGACGQLALNQASPVADADADGKGAAEIAS